MSKKDDLSRRLREEVKLRVYDDNLLSLSEEKEILKLGVSYGFSVEDTLHFLTAVCRLELVVQESILDLAIEDALSKFSAEGFIFSSKIDKSEFDAVVSSVLSTTDGSIPPDKCRSKVKAIILKNNFLVSEGFLKGGSWFSNIPL